MQGLEGNFDSPAGTGLSDRQKECLRLVGQGMSSKEIAQRVGLSPQTVDTYLKAAMARLNVANRREAARRFLESEASQLSASPSLAVELPLPDGQVGATAAGRYWAGLLLPPPLGGRPNELTAGARTFAALRIAAIGTVVVIAIALLIAAALRTFA